MPKKCEKCLKFKTARFLVAQLDVELTIYGQKTKELTKHTLVSDALDTVPQAYWKGSD
jgi:hypothetical protein